MTAGMLAVAIDAGQSAAHWLGGRLGEGSLEGAVVIGLVWLVCWRVRSIPASMRALLWWLASLKLVLSFVALPAISLPLLPPPAPVETIDLRHIPPLPTPEFVQLERPVQI